MFPAVEKDALKIADANWHSVDILTQVYMQLLSARGMAVTEYPYQFNSSESAANAVRRGEVDILAECWTACTGGVSAKPLGLNGTEGIYMPDYVLKSVPPLADWTDVKTTRRALLRHGVHLIGPPAAWGGVPWQRLVAHLGLNFTIPQDDVHLITEVVESLKWQRPFAFYFWEPHSMTSIYKLQPVRLPNDPLTGKAFYQPTALWTVWNSQLANSTADVMLSDWVWSLGGEDLKQMIQNMMEQVSYWMPDGACAYELACENSAKKWLCELGSFRGSVPTGWCNLRKMWPCRDEGLPEKVLLLTKKCRGFAKCVADNGTLLEQPERGYAIDHYREIMTLLRYDPDNYIIKCVHESSTQAVLTTGRGLGDAAHACFTITASRLSIADFTPAFHSTGLRVLVRRPDTNVIGNMRRMWALFEPFEPATWFWLLGGACIAGLLIYLSERWHLRVLRRRQKAMVGEQQGSQGTATTSEERGGKGAAPAAEDGPATGAGAGPLPAEQERGGSQGTAPQASVTSRVSVIGSLSGVSKESMTQGVVEARHSLSSVVTATRALMGEDPDTDAFKTTFGKGVVSMLRAMSIVLIALYTANLASILTVRRFSANIAGVADLRGKTAAILCNTTVQAWLEEYEPNVKVRCVDTYEDLAEEVAKDRTEAAIYDAPVLEHLAMRDCRVTLAGDVFAEQEYGILLPRGSRLLEPFSRAVSELRERGFHAPAYAKHFTSPGACPDEVDAKVDSDGIAPETLIGLVILGAGWKVFLFVVSAAEWWLCAGLPAEEGQLESQTIEEDLFAGLPAEENQQPESQNDDRSHVVGL